MADEVQLILLLSEPDTSAGWLDTLTVHLMRDLRDLGIEQVERIGRNDLPAGAKGSDAFTLGALALAVLPTFLPKLIEFLQTWSLRGENRKVKIRTPDGLEVEFTPQKRFSRDEIVALARELAGSSRSANGQEERCVGEADA